MLVIFPMNIRVVLLGWGCLNRSLHLTRLPVALGTKWFLPQKDSCHAYRLWLLGIWWSCYFYFYFYVSFPDLALATRFEFTPSHLPSSGTCGSRSVIKPNGNVFPQDTILISVILEICVLGDPVYLKHIMLLRVLKNWHRMLLMITAYACCYDTLSFNLA